MPTQPATLHICAALRMRASSCAVAGGERGMVLALRDTTGVFADDMAAIWLGPDAARFFDQHATELTAGRCVNLELYGIKRGPNELRARIKSCQLAPKAPSWTAHEEKLRISTQEQHT